MKTRPILGEDLEGKRVKLSAAWFRRNEITYDKDFVGIVRDGPGCIPGNCLGKIFVYPEGAHQCNGDFILRQDVKSIVEDE